MIKGIMSSLSKTLIIPAFVCFSILSGPSEATSDPKPGAGHDQIKEIESKLSRQKQKLKAVHSPEKDILTYLSDLEQEVAEKRASIDKLTNKIRLAKREIGNLEGRLSALETSLRNAEFQMAKRLVALYKYARTGYLKILASASDLKQFWRRAKYVKSIMEEDRKMLVSLTHEERKHKKDISLIKELLVKKQAVKDIEKKRLASLREDLEKKVIHLMKIHKEKNFYETAVKELQLAAQNLKQTLTRIEKKDAYNTARSGRFAEAKGKLPYPLEGKAIRGDKMSGFVSERLNLHKGIFIKGSSDPEVKAIFPGRVDFSGSLKGYGKVIIINHGSRFYTISAHLAQRIKEEGDIVEEGEIIGLAGVNRHSEKPRVYFEMRRGGKNLNPLKWLKAY